LIGAVPAHVLLLAHSAAVVCGIVALRTWPNARRPGAALLVGLGVGLLAVAILTFVTVDPQYPFWDYRTAYYPAGKAVAADPASLAELIGKGVNGFVNLPIVAYLFAPFSMLSLRYAIGLFTLCGLGMTIIAWLLLADLAGLKGRERWLLLLLFVANGPLQYSIKEGNTSQWVLAALAGGLYLLRARRSAAAGALLGLAAVLKLPLLLFGIYFVLRRDWRGALGFAGVCIAMGTISIVLFGWAFHVRWFELCVRQFGSQWIAAFNVQSIQSFVFRLQAPPELLHDWTAYPPGTGQRLAGYGLVGLLYLAALWSCLKASIRAKVEALGSTDVRGDLEFLLVVCLAVVSSPLSWSHYYTWLLLPAAFHLGSRSPFASGPIARGLGWVAIVLATLLVRQLQFSDQTLMTAYSTVGASTLLFSGLLWIGLISWSIMRTGTMVPPAISMSHDSLLLGADAKPGVLMARHTLAAPWTPQAQDTLS
jgi:alpha-1,2-mannosyltransferase